MTSIEIQELKSVYKGLSIQVQKSLLPTLFTSKPRVIILAGPTAVGKSAFGLNLAQALHGEIISADSMQVYRGMDIGTAKPTLLERTLVPHHLVDTRAISEPFNVVDFFHEASQCCREIHARQHAPIIVGGSGFYIHSLLYGPPLGPPACPQIRADLELQLSKYGSLHMFERLQLADPEYASTITSNDKQKIIRALEIMALTNTKVSDHAWSCRERLQEFDFRCWFIHRPRKELYQRIEKRCDEMLQHGFLDEVAALLKGGIEQNSSASQAIGYRQALAYVKSGCPMEAYEPFVKAFKQASRNYAKRQLTWFRKEPFFRWIDIDMHDPEVALDMIMQDFKLGC